MSIHPLARQVKTAVVGVPCGIEGSMVNEFVEAPGTRPLHACCDYQYHG